MPGVKRVLEIGTHKGRDILAPMASARCNLIRLESMPYEQAWKLQEHLASEVAVRARPATLLLLEHPHTYTFGRRGQSEHLLLDEEELKRRGINLYWVDRGGDVTYHGPGQLVGYPILPLAPAGLLAQSTHLESAPSTAHLPQADYVGYVRRLEAVLILALMRLGLVSGQITGLTGVWVQPHVLSRCPSCRPELRQRPAKIAAIGVKVDAKGVSRHGFALNVNPDMSYWDGIIGCGLKDTPMVSLADLLDPAPGMAQVMEAVAAAFGHVFGYEMIEELYQPVSISERNNANN